MDAVEDIKSRLNIEDVIGRYVELTRSGRNFKGLSPFGNEKTPSFVVSPEKQIWHDFSSGKGGNMFSFVMEMEGLDFKGALEMLARQAGVDLSQYRNSHEGDLGKQKDRIYEALELATKFYQLHFTKNKPAIDYVVKKRHFNRQTVTDFRIGYSPNSDRALYDFMKKKNFTDDELRGAGLVTKRYSGIGDMFRGRIMIPLMDAQGRVIGFTARILVDDPKAPKYINTPQTPVYDKSRHVFGLHLAKEAIRQCKYAVIVEGNLDVIASHQAGVKQVVATAGTAMTEMHLKALGRFTPDIRLAFDQDGAGVAATERSIPVAARAEVSLSIIDISGVKDPDELIQKDPKEWEVAITNNKYALDWLVEQYQKRLDLTSAVGKRQFSDVLLKVVRTLTDSVEQDHYLGVIAKITGVSTDAMRAKMSQKPRDEVRKPALKHRAPQAPIDPNNSERIKAQNQILAICMFHPEYIASLDNFIADTFPEEPAKKALTYLLSRQEFTLKADKSGLAKAIGSEYVDILVLLHEELYQNLENTELRYEATRLQVRLIEYYVKLKKAPLAAAMRTADNEQMVELLKQVKELDKLLNAHKSTVQGEY